MSGVNFFDTVTDPNYDFSSLQVYVNDKLTNIPANALTAAAGDDIRIVSLSDPSEPYPFFRPKGKDYIASIEEPLPFMSETDFSSYFYNCGNLASIPENLFINNPQITTFYKCFYGCDALTLILQGLFDNNPNVTNFSNCFDYCKNLIVNIQIGSTTTRSVNVSYFAHGTAAKGTVYCHAGSKAYNAFLASANANFNILTY